MRFETGVGFSMYWKISRRKIASARTQTFELLRRLITASPHAIHAWLRQTDKRRWSNARSFKPSWESRNALIASYIAPYSSVMDLGCGEMRLAQHLREGCTYQPVDLVMRSPDTIVCDFNRGEFPPNRKYDVIVCSGLIEYIYDLDGFIRKIVSSGTRAIITYSSVDAFPERSLRLQNGWVNSLSGDALIALFHQHGATLARRERTSVGQDLFEFVWS